LVNVIGLSKKPLVIFGAGKIAEAVSYFFNRDSEFEIHAYVIDDIFIKGDKFLNKPLIKFSSLLELFSPNYFTIFVAVGYQDMNKFRSDKFHYFRNNGYKFASYKSPYAQGEFICGENTIVMDGAIIQPFVTFGDNVFVWGGAMVGHHSVIYNHSWLSGGCLIGGSTKIGESSFIGMGTIVGHEVVTGKECMLGAGTLIIKSIGDYSVFLRQQDQIFRLNSSQFIRMSSCFSLP
jgi:sugar O-acyltransferase (sialic acid O-acetyltransferase NeuD family)